jgi:hypothetical protein
VIQINALMNSNINRLITEKLSLPAGGNARGVLYVNRCVVGALALGSLMFASIMPAAADMMNPSYNRNLPMRFQVWHDGLSESCVDNCREWISASGAITVDTPKDFEKFAHSHDIRGGTLVLDSDGGSVLASITLGHAIRKLGMTTGVGRIIEVTRETDDPIAGRFSPQANCGSICVFVLIAGNRRFVPVGAQVLVHDIWLDEHREDALTRTYSAEEVALMERDVGRLARYTSEMGAFGELLETAMRIAPWEPPRVLARDELRRLGLITTFDRPPKIKLSSSTRWQRKAAHLISSPSTRTGQQMTVGKTSHHLQQAQWQPDQNGEPDKR